jgi:hypothetical protein
MARVVDEDELVGSWMLLDEEMALLTGRRGPTKLAFALMLTFHQLHGRFPRGRTELPDDAVDYVARLGPGVLRVGWAYQQGPPR